MRGASRRRWPWLSGLLIAFAGAGWLVVTVVAGTLDVVMAVGGM